MSALNVNTPVGELVAQQPGLARVLEELDIDYCCQGNLPLAAACENRAIDPQEVLTRCADQTEPQVGEQNWNEWSLTELCDHIEQTHHALLRREIPRLEKLLVKVADAHGERHPELLELRVVFQNLKAELLPHMLKEEQILFPAIRQLEAAAHAVELSFGSVRNPINMMEHEHLRAGNALWEIQSLTQAFQVPEDACPSYRELLVGLKLLQEDLHLHIHKENNILFPKAAIREAKLQS